MNDCRCLHFGWINERSTNPSLMGRQANASSNQFHFMKGIDGIGGGSFLFLLLFSKLMGQRCSLLLLKKDKQPTIQFHWLRPNEEGSNQLELVGWMNWLVKLPLLLLNKWVMGSAPLAAAEVQSNWFHQFPFPLPRPYSFHWREEEIN